MLKNYQNLMLRVISGLLISLACYLGVEYLWLGIRDFGVYRIPELLVASGILFALIVRFPRSNFGSWFLVSYLVISNAIWMGPAVDSTGCITTNSLFVLPLLFFFFLGLARGVLVNAIFFAWLVMQLPLHQWNVGIFGESGLLFLVFYLVNITICYTLEWIRRSVAKQSSEIAEIDSLTNLPNRSGFLLRMEAAIGRNVPFYLVQMDLDHFRRINLTTGSLFADELLRSVSNVLREQRMVHDVARHYGDEFVFIVETDEGGLTEVVSSIQERLELLGRESEYGIRLAASFGASCYPQNARNGRELWNQAEMALKNAKTEGRTRLRLFKEADAEAERRHAYLVDALRQDVENGDLQVFFQPKISIHEKRITGMEALARWNSPQWGSVSPQVFISLAEQHGLIIPLGDLVLERSLAFLASLQELGYSGLTVSVNVSVAQLSQQHFIAKLAELCARHGVVPGHVYLEITESMLLYGEVGDILVGLRTQGFRLALDDFGTGYSSMSYLHRYQFDELKVDKSFTDGLLRSGRERHVFRSILELSRGLGMHTVVEGVETLPQIETIRNYGAPQIQGWVFARAMPAQDMQEFLARFDYDEALQPGQPSALQLISTV